MSLTSMFVCLYALIGKEDLGSTENLCLQFGQQTSEVAVTATEGLSSTGVEASYLGGMGFYRRREQ